MALRIPNVRRWLTEQGVCACPGGALPGGRWAAQVGLATRERWSSLGGLCISERGSAFELVADIGVRDEVRCRLWPAERHGAPDGQQQLHALANDFIVECTEAAWPWLDGIERQLRQLHPHDAEVEVVAGGLAIRVRGLARDPTDVLSHAVALWRSAASATKARHLLVLDADRETLESLFPFELHRLAFSVATPRSAIGSSEALHDQLAAATEAYSGVVERVGDKEIARVSLEGHGLDGPGAPFVGELHLLLFASGHPRQLVLDVTLPGGLPRVALKPEVGLRGALAALREIELGDRALDDAYVIRGGGVRGDGDLAALLDDIRPELLSLAPLGLTLTTTGDRLQVTIRSPREDKLDSAIDALFTLWRRLAQMGLRLGGH